MSIKQLNLNSHLAMPLSNFSSSFTFFFIILFVNNQPHNTFHASHPVLQTIAYLCLPYDRLPVSPHFVYQKEYIHLQCLLPRTARDISRLYSSILDLTTPVQFLPLLLQVAWSAMCSGGMSCWRKKNSSPRLRAQTTYRRCCRSFRCPTGLLDGLVGDDGSDETFYSPSLFLLHRRVMTTDLTGSAVNVPLVTRGLQSTLTLLGSRLCNTSLPAMHFPSNSLLPVSLCVPGLHTREVHLVGCQETVETIRVEVGGCTWRLIPFLNRQVASG